MSSPRAPRGRGTTANPENRFEQLHFQPDPPDEHGEPCVAPQTQFFRDASRTLLAENESPDVGFRWSLNPYRGCEHGCTYCYARPSHEYLGFSAGLDFESRILVKERAPDLLRTTFLDPKWKPEVVALSGNTDCYQPIEKTLGITRRCLEVFREFRNPVGIVTKSALVTRDLEPLAELSELEAARVMVSVTTLDRALARRLEPRAASPEKRIAAIRELAHAGVSVGVMIAPLIPGLNDSEVPHILSAAAQAGAQTASWVLLRLAKPLDDLFGDWLDENYPDRKNRVLGRIRECRGGKLSDPRFGHRMRGEGPYARQLADLFALAARREALDRPLPALSTAHFRRPARAGEQLGLY